MPVRGLIAAALLGGCVVDVPAVVDPRFSPDVIYASGRFAWDPVALRAVPYRADGVEQPIALRILALDGRWFDTGEDAYRCELTLSTTRPRRLAEWAVAAGPDVSFGLVMPDDAALDGVCPAHDEDRWGDLDAALTAGPWGLGVGALDPLVADRVRADVEASGGAWGALAPTLIGGGFHWGPLANALPGAYAPNDAVVAYALEADGALSLDGAGQPVPLLAADALADPLPRALYVIDAVYGVDAAFLEP